jgi:hypothetical protein
VLSAHEENPAARVDDHTSHRARELPRTAGGAPAARRFTLPRRSLRRRCRARARPPQRLYAHRAPSLPCGGRSFSLRRNPGGPLPRAPATAVHAPRRRCANAPRAREGGFSALS